ncbi:MAG: hypothetical protein ACN4GW_04720 [Desulforhopalus sp.]
MTSDEFTIKSYLDELYRQTGGDTECQVSMYEVGVSIGLEKTEAGSLAEKLMVQGLAELKTLSGGIGITAEGLSSLGFSAPSPIPVTDSIQLGSETVVTDSDRQTIHLLTEEIKAATAEHKIDFTLLEEIVIDIKTLEIQLLSPQPKNQIITEIIRSLQGTLEKAEVTTVAEKLAAVIN